jgi:ribosome biogenesis GTP-binding protein YsxC/EngB
MNFSNCTFIASYGLHSQLPISSRPEIVFSGRSNVGKSSLINKLCNRKALAKTSSTPGKTATINFYSCELAYLVDLPGYGYAKVNRAERQRWDELINSYFEEKRPNVLLLQLLDSRHSPSAEDNIMLDYLKHYNIPFIAVLTKIDKLNKNETSGQILYFQEYMQYYPNCINIITVSALKGNGIEDLQLAIENFVYTREK